MRYVDDLVLLAPHSNLLLEWCAAIEAFLGERLGLTLRSDLKLPLPVAQGIDFVGWRTWWNRRPPRQRTVANLESRVQEFERAAVRAAAAGVQRIDLTAGKNTHAVQGLHAALASYSGHLRHGAAWRARAGVWQRHPWLSALFTREGWRFDQRWPWCSPVLALSLRRQYAALLRHAGEDCLLFFQVGRFIEFYGPQRILAARVLGLRRTRLGRACYAFTVGFPHRFSGKYLRRVLAQGFKVVWVPQVHPALGAGWARQSTRIHLPRVLGAAARAADPMPFG